MNPEPSFQVGQLVTLRADKTRSGPIIAALDAIQGQPRYRVFHGTGDIQDYYGNQLIEAEAFRSSQDDLVSALASNRFLEADEFRARLTAERLAHPLTDNLYALRAARIKSIPFQFKPLLRFLRADRPRLLISDEVGVGKTIESGLILKELDTRQGLGNVLVICPKALVSKWQAEMRRFDEDFRELTAENLRYCLHESHLEGVWPTQYSRAIAPLELIRSERYVDGIDQGRQRIRGLTELDPSPQFGLLIVDEAHHLRNPETSSFRLVEFLCEVSEAVVFLTATPVHLGSKDLFALLKLLRPDVFRDQAVFDLMVEPNRYLGMALRHLRTAMPADTWPELALSQLTQAVTTTWGQRSLASDPRFNTWLARLQSGVDLTAEERIRASRDIEEVHSLSSIMNRTRRRDVGAFTIREPHTVPVPFSEEQQEFYSRLLAFRREVLLRSYDPRITNLIVDTLERQASSCLPALASAIDSFLVSGRFSTDALTDAIDDDVLGGLVPAGLETLARDLRSAAQGLSGPDPKYDSFRELVADRLTQDGSRKVLVFSFFLHTIRYLDERLRGEGLRVGVVTGRVPESDREQLRGRFRLPPEHPDALDVLLSSEVGCEGLDYEFCDCLINYDLPWNPMRVEQRIGRIDRFGQLSPKVHIFNFITPGTVEERIFHRCFDRIGLFRETVGDLEEILGDLVQDLNRLAFDATLTPEQAEERAQQLADNVVRLAVEQRSLEADSNLLVGLDQVVEGEIQSLLDDGRYVSGEDLRTLVSLGLARSAIAGRLSNEERDPRLNHLRFNREGRREMLKRVRAMSRQDRTSQRFANWLEGDTSFLTVTFDQDLALEQRDLPFITPVHPLARACIDELKVSEEPLVTSVQVVNQDHAPGKYLFVCELWDVVALRRESRLVSFAVNLETLRPAPEVAAALLQLLRTSSSSSSMASTEATERAFGLVEEQVHKGRQAELALLRSSNDLLVDNRMATLDAYHTARMSRVLSDLQQATEPRIERMRRSELSRIESDDANSKAELESTRVADIVGRRLAAGIIEIRTN